MHATFKLIKSSWGISIGIEIEECKFAGFSREANSIFSVSGKSYLAVNETNISENGLKYLFSAFYDNRELLDELLKDPTVFNVEHIDYAHADYQDEGMYCVAVNWINARFNTAIELPAISFDRVKNKYLFAIEHLQEPVK